MIPLSQSHLASLDTCARKYQYIFFDALSGPVTHDQRLTTQWGSQFHLLMQQQALALPVGVLSPADREMADSLAALKKAAPDVFGYLSTSQGSSNDESHSSQRDSDIFNLSDTFSQSEHRRTLEFNGYLLTVVYDLLVTGPSNTPSHSTGESAIGRSLGQIFDWKTHQRPPKKEWLKQDWQTRLYPYVLCETSELTPEQVSMTYWFVRVEGQDPSFYRFDYTLAQHDATRKDLQRLTDDLTQMRDRASFPKVAIEKGICDRCPFNVRCHRSSEASQDKKHPTQLLEAARQLTAETVEEIPL